MRLIVACTSAELIRPGVLEVITADGYRPEIRPTPGPFGYYELLAEVWDGRDDLMLIEQDIRIRSGIIDELTSCDEDWCKCVYPYPPFGLYGGLGCTRFSQFVQRWIPDAVEIAGKMYDSQHPPRHWCRLDSWLQSVLCSRGMAEHIHMPPVDHLSDRTDNRCLPGVRHHDIPL